MWPIAAISVVPRPRWCVVAGAAIAAALLNRTYCSVMRTCGADTASALPRPVFSDADAGLDSELVMAGLPFVVALFPEQFEPFGVMGRPGAGLRRHCEVKEDSHRPGHLL